MRDQLCRIVKSTAGNEGRRVVTVGIYDPEVHGWTPYNAWLLAADKHPLWAVTPLQPLRSISFQSGHLGYGLGLTLFPDSWLEPIIPAADASDEVLVVEADFAYG
jgi:hypothetical protein